MSTNILRIRFLSFKNAAKQPFSNVVLYVKKLVAVSMPAESTIKLQEKDPNISVVVVFNEAFDISVDDDFFQILVIDSKSKKNAVADCIVRRSDLIGRYIMDPRYEQNSQPALPCSITVERDYQLLCSLQLLEDCLQENPIDHRLLYSQLIRGHAMVVKQFTQPVSCSICHKFIWGFYHQGYEGLQCSFVTHRKCRQKIPFDCRRSPSNADRLKTNDQDKGSNRHTLQKYRAPLVQSLINAEQNYCHHCGSQVLRNALKCIECHFVIHKHCESNVPPMCTMPYVPLVTDNSTASEDHPIWLDPLPNEALTFLPKCSDFKCFGRLGRGRYGNVYCVQHLSSKKYLAIKVVDGSNKEARHQFEVEKEILFRYSQGNPYIIKVYCSFHQGDQLFLAMELVDGDALNDKIVRTRMNEDEIRFYLAEIISALQYLHSNNIVYRDLKLEHVIINSANHVRLVDYGLARLLKTADELCFTICGTKGYTAPEVLLLGQHIIKDGYSYSVDYWALGMIFAQMLCGRAFDFYCAASSGIDYQSIVDEHLQSVDFVSSEARSCLSGLLEMDPKKRLGSPNSPHGSIREHAFFRTRQNFHWEDIDEGLMKSIYARQSGIDALSDESCDMPFPRLLFDRTKCAKDEWLTAGKSTCTSDQEEKLKVFDYVKQSTWNEFF